MDVDGTLYHARPMRLRVVLALLLLPLSGWRRARRVWRRIRCYRVALEEVRHTGVDGEDVSLVHLRRAAELAGESEDDVRSTIEEWLLRRPLAYLRGCRREGLVEFLDDLRRRGIQIGFFSDYPVADKLAALGVDGYSSVCLSAGDPEINSFKPGPRGFRRGAELMGLPCQQVLYVGDRPDVDAAGAGKAEMPCAILGRRPSAKEPGYISVRGFSELARLVQDWS